MTETRSNPMPPDAGKEPVPGPEVEPAEQLAHLVPAVWRTMKRASRSERDLPATEGQVTILRLVVQHGGVTPAQLADVLHVARPTVSNLLKGLVRDGLVERLMNKEDARQVTIAPTERGRSVLQTFRQERTRVLREALEGVAGEQPIDSPQLVASFRLLLSRLEVIAQQVQDDEHLDAARSAVADEHGFGRSHR